MNFKSEVVQGHVVSQIIEANGDFPNNPDLPLLVYKGGLLLKPDDDPDGILSRFAGNNWSNGWRGGIYDFHHYHSTTHEVLGVFCGTADIQFGGDEGVCVEVSRGDVVVIPAGVAHKCLKSTPDFLCVGAYPEGKAYDMNDGKGKDRKKSEETIRKAPLPTLDPIYGTDGPLIERWGL